jgi:hypothetical protein
VIASLPVIAVGLVAEAEAVERAGLKVAVAGVAGNDECAGVVHAGVPVIAGGERYLAEKVERLHLGGARASVTGEGQRLLQPAGGLLVTARHSPWQLPRYGLLVLGRVARRDPGRLRIARHLSARDLPPGSVQLILRRHGQPQRAGQ